jgi:hypothetical protein
MLSDEEGFVGGGNSGQAAPASTAQRHLRSLSDAIEMASDVTTEKRASKRVSRDVRNSILTI